MVQITCAYPGGLGHRVDIRLRAPVLGQECDGTAYNVVIGGVRPQPPEIVGIVLAVGIGEEGERRLDSFEAFSDGAGVSLPAPSRPEAHRVFFRQLSENFVRAVCAPVLADEEVSSRRNDDIAVDDV